MSFKDMLLKNLQSNGFPAKKVSFPLETLYEKADEKGENLNAILDDLENTLKIKHEKTLDKIIFSADIPKNKEDMMQQAQDMMANMSPEQLKEVQDMVANMSDEEKAQMMEQAKKMGLF